MVPSKIFFPVATLCVLLSACGGGGGGNAGGQSNGQSDLGVKPQPSAPIIPPTPPVMPPVTPPAVELPVATKLDVGIDGSMLAYMSKRNLDQNSLQTYLPEILDTMSPIDMRLMTDSSNTGLSDVDVRGGSIVGPFIGFSVPSMQLHFSKVVRSINGQNFVQYAVSKAQAGCQECLFAIAAQHPVTTNAPHAGMGSWKQTGYRSSSWVYPGIGMGVGAFVFGDKTPDDAVKQASSANYVGLAQWQDEPNYAVNKYVEPYYDAFNQGTAKVDVAYDKATATIQLKLSGLQAWYDSMYLSGLDRYLQMPNTVSSTVECSGQRENGSDIFVCPVASNGIKGFIRGRFFGPGAEAFAGTYTLSGLAIGGWTGAFVANKSI